MPEDCEINSGQEKGGAASVWLSGDGQHTLRITPRNFNNERGAKTAS